MSKKRLVLEVLITLGLIAATIYVAYRRAHRHAPPPTVKRMPVELPPLPPDVVVRGPRPRTTVFTPGEVTVTYNGVKMPNLKLRPVDGLVKAGTSLSKTGLVVRGQWMHDAIAYSPNVSADYGIDTNGNIVTPAMFIQH